jgi:hypothetical protein
MPACHHPASCVALPAGLQVVVLSPDAVEPLLNIEPGTVYVVGGIVDRTVIKGATVGFAVSPCLKCTNCCKRGHGRGGGGAGRGGCRGKYFQWVQSRIQVCN